MYLAIIEHKTRRRKGGSYPLAGPIHSSIFTGTLASLSRRRHDVPCVEA
jgi:hypothetical protein